MRATTRGNLEKISGRESTLRCFRSLSVPTSTGTLEKFRINIASVNMRTIKRVYKVPRMSLSNTTFQ
jgi:hypothetical protein